MPSTTNFTKQHTRMGVPYRRITITIRTSTTTSWITIHRRPRGACNPSLSHSLLFFHSPSSVTLLSTQENNFDISKKWIVTLFLLGIIIINILVTRMTTSTTTSTSEPSGHSGIQFSVHPSKLTWVRERAFVRWLLISRPSCQHSRR